jgi:hypothetical protein
LAGGIGGEACSCQIQLVSVGDTAHGIEDHVACNDIVAVQRGERAVVCVEFDAGDVLVQPYGDTVTAHVGAQGLRNLLVDEAKQICTSVDQCDRDVEGREHGGVFAPDHAASEHDQAPGDFRRRQDRVRITYARIVEGNVLRAAWA